jgi:hypothetical protein
MTAIRDKVASPIQGWAKARTPCAVPARAVAPGPLVLPCRAMLRLAMFWRLWREDRHSWRMRTLVTRMVHRDLSAKKNARALISMMARSTNRSNQRPDTLMQDRNADRSTKPSCDAQPGPLPAAPIAPTARLYPRIASAWHRSSSSAISHPAPLHKQAKNPPSAMKKSSTRLRLMF